MSLNARATSWWVILLVPVVGAALDLALMSPPAAELLLTIARGTHGLLLPPLMMNAVALPIVIGGLIVWAGGLRWRDLGLAPGRSWRRSS